MRFKLFLGYMLFVTIQISLMCQKLDLIETESETWKSQMYEHNAGQPVSSLYTKYYVLSDIYTSWEWHQQIMLQVRVVWPCLGAYYGTGNKGTQHSRLWVCTASFPYFTWPTIYTHQLVVATTTLTLAYCVYLCCETGLAKPCIWNKLGALSKILCNNYDHLHYVSALRFVEECLK